MDTSYSVMFCKERILTPPTSPQPILLSSRPGPNTSLRVCSFSADTDGIQMYAYRPIFHTQHLQLKQREGRGGERKEGREKERKKEKEKGRKERKERARERVDALAFEDYGKFAQLCNNVNMRMVPGTMWDFGCLISASYLPFFPLLGIDTGALQVLDLLSTEPHSRPAQTDPTETWKSFLAPGCLSHYLTV